MSRSSAMNSSAPEIWRVSGRFSRIRMMHSKTNMINTMGNAITTHSKNEIVVPVSCSMNSRPIRFGGLPIG